MNIFDKIKLFNRIVGSQTLTVFEKAVEHPKIETTEQLVRASKLVKRYQAFIYISFAAIIVTIIHFSK